MASATSSSWVLFLLSKAFVAAASLALLAAFSCSLVALLTYLEAHLKAAKLLRARVALASLLCLLALALTESHLPRLYLALSLALNLVHSTNISSSAPQSPTSSSWSSITAKAALFFLAPITAHFSLLSHVSTLHRSWHTRRSRPLLAGGRLDWDLHDVAAMAGAATTRAEYTTTEVLALLFVGPWGTTILSWLETVAAARWVQRSGSGSWLLPTSVPTGRDDKQRVA